MEISEKRKAVINRYVKSSIITFLTGFCLVFVANIDNINLDSLGEGTVMGLVFLAVRGGIKAVLELSITWFKD